MQQISIIPPLCTGPEMVSTVLSFSESHQGVLLKKEVESFLTPSPGSGAHQACDQMDVTVIQRWFQHSWWFFPCCTANEDISCIFLLRIRH